MSSLQGRGVEEGGGGRLTNGREGLPSEFYLTFANAHIIKERISSLPFRPKSTGGRQPQKPLIEIPILSVETSARRHLTNREVINVGQVAAAAVK